MANRPRLLELGRRMAAGVLDLIYPPVCSLCAAVLAAPESPLCHACADELAGGEVPFCPRCGQSVGPFTPCVDGCASCRHRQFAFDGVIRLGPYEGRLREAILRTKNAAGERLALALGWLLGQRRGPAFPAGVDWVIPVPHHWLRRVQHGYEHTAALARSAARVLGLDCRPGWLRRLRNTPHQTSLPASLREENVRGAFQAAGRARLAGKNVVLVDDVLTTGSTCSEAAKALKRAGAARVHAAVLARSEARP